ncbi:MerR family DNA-binding transcriptional regulator [Cryobacterium roopkundense]|uniref:DNA-binding transcriptional MerR regulator n=1 Tax=Cryobacterium roopkundense TaxID=1001240 RepID=A0A7W8ZUP8_9MICO|nr:MerR family transcriptional regulator [Cryobacterium roopkundense]MBB5640526.1 DNA-binding transcriptional MerR regulator [Cryobacterium roopkundense]
MTWSTRELADLAGTTVNAVRHYHSLGLLDAPERKDNGYKQYQVHHLVRLIQVRRIAELGVPLAQVRADEDGVVVLGGLQQLDVCVQEEIERLHRARSDMAAILRDHAPVHTPRGFEALASRLSVADQALVHIFTTLSAAESVSGLRQMVLTEPDTIRLEFDGLHSNADETTRERVAHRMVAARANWRSPDRPWSGHRRPGRWRRDHEARQTISEALRELYNSAQQDVLQRARTGASEEGVSLSA